MEPRQSDLERERARILRSARWGQRVAILIVVGGLVLAVVSLVSGNALAAASSTIAVGVGAIAFCLFNVSRDAVK